MTQRLHVLYHGMCRRMPQSSASCFSSSPCIGTGASPQSHTPTIGSAAGGRPPFRCRPQVVLPPPAPLPCLAELRFSSSFPALFLADAGPAESRYGSGLRLNGHQAGRFCHPFLAGWDTGRSGVQWVRGVQEARAILEKLPLHPVQPYEVPAVGGGHRVPSNPVPIGPDQYDAQLIDARAILRSRREVISSRQLSPISPSRPSQDASHTHLPLGPAVAVSPRPGSLARGRQSATNWAD